MTSPASKALPVTPVIALQVAPDPGQLIVIGHRPRRADNPADLLRRRIDQDGAPRPVQKVRPLIRGQVHPGLVLLPLLIRIEITAPALGDLDDQVGAHAAVDRPAEGRPGRVHLHRGPAGITKNRWRRL